jgi:predicted NBD/HSP70 family sugar kinase
LRNKDTSIMTKSISRPVSGASRNASDSDTVAGQALPVSGPSYVAGADIGGTNLRLALADAQGIIAARWSASTVGIRNAESVVELIRNGVQAMLDEVSAPAGSLKAIAAGAPGATNVGDGIVVATSYLMGWRNVPFRALLEDALHVPAAVDNDVNLAALGEGWLGAAQHVSEFVFLGIGTGVGAGIVLNRQIFRGVKWNAGEVGYMLVPGTLETKHETGRPGALEEMIGGEGIQAQWRILWNENATALPSSLLATEIFDHAVQGDALAQTILAQTARILFYAIYNIWSVLNCPLFVLGGGIGVHPALLHEVNRLLTEWQMDSSLQLTHSLLGRDAQLFGALRFALDTAELEAIKTPRE